jgi:hypothetical protein
MTYDLMIDIETLSTHATNAVVTQIGVCTFDIANARILSRSLWGLDIGDQLIRGREVSTDTLAWWREQEYSPFLSDVLSPSEVLNELREQYMLGGNVRWVWANGMLFDIGNISTLHSEYLGGVPDWKYNVFMDLRTYWRAVCTSSRWDSTHNALEDAVAQAEWLIAWNHRSRD